VASPPSLPELLLPAGGFDQAIAAIEGGADALYFGFADFSARKQARNFDRLEYRRLYRFAREKGVKLYAAMNTVILGDEIEGAARLLAFLGRFPPDAVIVQDWGLARMIKERHHRIAIHASTQAAVQGSAAAGVARELGASRIVLPRETSLPEMRRIREEEPGLEYEAFVHGALCYSFSGLCLASGLVLGRSGNRGECAQLCRSYYTAEGGAISGRTGYWFSCRDLDLSERVGELAAAGISSLKVEGRMKSPEYCYAVASLYRGLIDRLGGDGPGEDEIAARREAARIAFSRSPTEGWIAERGGASLLDAAYPGHRGVPAGRVVSNDSGSLVVILEGALGLRDGLLGFERGDQSRPVGFSALELRDERTGRELVRARAGSRVALSARSDGRPCEGLRPGDELYRVSARELDRKAPSPEEYEAAKQDLPLRLVFGASGLEAELGLPHFDGSRDSATVDTEWAKIEADRPLPLDMAKSAAGLEKALALFRQSGDADFVLLPEIEAAARTDIAPGLDGAPRSCAVSELFIPPSVLKREKNRIYARAAELIGEAELAYVRDSPAFSEISTRARVAGRTGLPAPPPRAAIVFPREGLHCGMPFATARDLASGEALPVWGGRSWFPLAPLVADRERYTRLAIERAAAELGAGTHLVLGLGALHHLPIARELRRMFPDAGARLSFFLDFNLYIANDLSFASFSALLPGIEFAYRYIETEGNDGFEAAGAGLAPCGRGFEAPLFQSLGCLLKHHLAGGVCPNPCGKSWSAVFTDRDRRYRTIVEDCVTTLFRIEGEERGII
jgi:putative protease